MFQLCVYLNPGCYSRLLSVSLLNARVQTRLMHHAFFHAALFLFQHGSYHFFCVEVAPVGGGSPSKMHQKSDLQFENRLCIL